MQQPATDDDPMPPDLPDNILAAIHEAESDLDWLEDPDYSAPIGGRP